MDLLKTILLYLTMVFVSSVQSAPDPALMPQTPTTAPTAVAATLAPTLPPTPSPTPVPTPNITPNNDYRTVKVGDKGDDVKLLQRRLAELGYYTGKVDGVFGNQTRRSVERFQYYQGLSVDGIAGKRTLTVLYESTEVVYAPVDVTPTPTAPPTGGSTAAITPPPATATPAPTFVPAPTATIAPTVAPSVAATDTVVPSAAATDTAAPTETATAEVTATVEASVEPSITPPTPALILTQDFVLAGTTEPLTLLPADGQPTPEPPAEAALLHPMQLDTDVYVPLLEILRDAGTAMIPGVGTERQEVAFSLLNDLYQISYVLDNEGNVTDLQVLKNMEPQVMANRNAILADGVLYLPLDTMAGLTQITFVLDEAQTRYTVTLPTLPVG